MPETSTKPPARAHPCNRISKSMTSDANSETGRLRSCTSGPFQLVSSLPLHSLRRVLLGPRTSCVHWRIIPVTDQAQLPRTMPMLATLRRWSPTRSLSLRSARSWLRLTDAVGAPVRKYLVSIERTKYLFPPLPADQTLPFCSLTTSTLPLICDCWMSRLFGTLARPQGSRTRTRFWTID